MSYQVLARKWRPRSFETLVGQEHVVRALTHGLSNGRLHHAYLFTGTRGVGKTTIARILAKALNCELGVSPSPCGVCDACQSIDSGRFVDLLEVDAATNTRVDEMRQLLENAVYAPTRGRYKVYVIDEVHMLSNAAFNAMLKTLEEPPEHVKFILATTDPQKIPVTVLSRCLQFNLKQMSQSAIVGHLRTVLEAEKVSAEESALRLIAHAASGSMRDGLSLLDQAIGYGSGAVEAKSVAAMLGALDDSYLNKIVECLIVAEPQILSTISGEMAARSLSCDAALLALAELWVDIQTAQVCGLESIEQKPNSREIAGFAERLDPQFVQLAYTITSHGRAELHLAPSPEAGFLMTLLRLHAFRPVGTTEEKKKSL
jgi:DNA polymerase III subunit gamma/tau